ncbi:hypothetical protein [Paenibacillus turpanensis]|nr:hypothetical protein [Paenibacillus turpanensis]
MKYVDMTESSLEWWKNRISPIGRHADMRLKLFLMLQQKKLLHRSLN